MVCLKDVTFSFGMQHLVVLDDENQPEEKGTILAIQDSLIGGYAKQWPNLTNPFHMPQWSQEVALSKTSNTWALNASHHQGTSDSDPLPTFGRCIIEGKARWGNSIEFLGEFHYIQGYWEWTEDILSRCSRKLRAAEIYDAVYASLFTYDCNVEVLKAFCEAWCPSTNTLLTSHGEMSISLWDIHSLAGLPIGGYLYDEMIPNTKELTGVDECSSLYLPPSCKYLFQAYHLLRGNTDRSRISPVSVETWVKFWSKKAHVHDAPPRRDKRALTKGAKSRPKETHNPSGELIRFEEWTEAEQAVFERLGIRRKREEAYLAAHLVCWLCTFVLPNDEIGCIRPSTFKIASMMAAGKRIGLAAPVLANIYKGLNKIASFPRPPRVRSTFPVHFVHAWLGCYFKTHFPIQQGIRSPTMTVYSGEGGAKYFEPEEARARIHKGDLAVWTYNILDKSTGHWFVDSDAAQGRDWNFFTAIRSGYLTWRQGNSFVVEPYSPHRFSRQFGFYQLEPGALVKDIREASLDEGIKLWRLSVLHKSMSKVYLPHAPPNAKRFCSADYKEWWSRVHGDYFEKNMTKLVKSQSSKQPSKNMIAENNKRKEPPKPTKEKSSSGEDINWKRRKAPESSKPIENDGNDHLPPSQDLARELEKELFGIDEGEESEGSVGSVAVPKSLVDVSSPPQEAQKEISNIPTPNIVAAPSVFVGSNMILSCKRRYLQLLWDGLREAIVKRSLDCISAMQDEVSPVIDDMKECKGFDISHIEEALKVLFEKATAYDNVRSASLERASKELLAQQLSEAKDRLSTATTKHSEEADLVASTKSELKCLQKNIKELKKREKELSTLLKERRETLCVAEGKVHEIEGEIAAIESTSPMSDEVVESLEASKQHLESAKEGILDINPFA